jgi:hypothetical protein
MDIALRGSSPCATTAAILLMTRARQLGGLRLRASLVGDPDDIVAVKGPAIAFSPVLASCGIGRELGNGGAVVVPGPPGQPLLVSFHNHGTEGWFRVDREGAGQHPGTQAFARLSRDPRVPARRVGKDLRRAMEALGMSPEPAVLDVLFGAPLPPLTRLSLALRAGRAMSGGRGEPVTRYLTGDVDHDTIPTAFDAAGFEQQLASGDLDWVLDGLVPSIRDRIEEWLTQLRQLANEDGGRDWALVHALAEVSSHLVQLPKASILPPLAAHEDSVAMALRAGLTAEGDEDANAQLRSMFLFLGGRYVSAAEHVFEVDASKPPADPAERWRWFCDQATRGRDRADELWPTIIDPPQ